MTVIVEPCVALNTISSQCLTDCAGTYYKSGTTPPHHSDNCGVCVSSSVTNSPSCIKDCTGTYKLSNYYFTDNCGYCVAPGSNTNAHKDSCGVCNGTNSEINQCGVCFGTTDLDNCGNPVCKNMTCVENCDGSYTVTQSKSTDPCGFCVALNTISSQCLTDCAGTYYKSGTTAPHKYDPCGVCITSSSTTSSECIQDCHGNWNLNQANAWFYDNCHTCVAPGTDPNGNKDACGVCFGNVTAEKNQCGVCFGTTDLDNCGNPEEVVLVDVIQTPHGSYLWGAVVPDL